MRTYGRIYAVDAQGIKLKPQPAGYPRWQKVETDANGFNDAVYLTTLCQVLLLNLNESPFYANYGIPAHPTIVQQVQPDFYVSRTQALFAQYFAALIVAKSGANPPTYRINVTTQQGAKVVLSVPQ